MRPIDHFFEVWTRCGHISAIHAYLANTVTAALRPDELLRAEWVARVSAMDLYVHELVAQGMVSIFEGSRPSTPAFARFSVSNETMQRIRAAATVTDAAAAFDLEVRTKLGRMTFQYPDDIADAVRLISPIELWNEVALRLGANSATKATVARSLKQELSLLVGRRNRIAHEGDLRPALPRLPWAIQQSDLAAVSVILEKIVTSIDGVV